MFCYTDHASFLFLQVPVTGPSSQNPSTGIDLTFDGSLDVSVYNAGNYDVKSFCYGNIYSFNWVADSQASCCSFNNNVAQTQCVMGGLAFSYSCPTTLCRTKGCSTCPIPVACSPDVDHPNPTYFPDPVSGPWIAGDQAIWATLDMWCQPLTYDVSGNTYSVDVPASLQIPNSPLTIPPTFPVISGSTSPVPSNVLSNNLAGVVYNFQPFPVNPFTVVQPTTAAVIAFSPSSGIRTEVPLNPGKYRVFFQYAVPNYNTLQSQLNDVVLDVFVVQPPPYNALFGLDRFYWPPVRYPPQYFPGGFAVSSTTLAGVGESKEWMDVYTSSFVVTSQVTLSILISLDMLSSSTQTTTLYQAAVGIVNVVVLQESNPATSC